jgi:hypothetical protein
MKAAERRLFLRACFVIRLRPSRRAFGAPFGEGRTKK